MYRVILPRRVARQLDKLPPDVHEQVLHGLLALTNNPHPQGARKLFGYERTWCAYLPDRFRVYYDVDPDRAIVLILAVARSRLGGTRLALEVDD